MFIMWITANETLKTFENMIENIISNQVMLMKIEKLEIRKIQK